MAESKPEKLTRRRRFSPENLANSAISEREAARSEAVWSPARRARRRSPAPESGDSGEDVSPAAERSQRRMRRWRVRLGMKSLEGRTCMVAGHVSCPESSQRWMLERSYVTPVHRLTGDLITSIEIGHRKGLGTVTYSFSLTFAIVSLFASFLFLSIVIVSPHTASVISHEF